ncbi:MAG: hypothetical protein P8N43_08410 [Alphaproteobacteria bacterium]|nr:hypothetical protein [Alphaproteobacteria bacterium]
MADLRISELPPSSAGAVQPGEDFLALADTSASETKKVTPSGVVLNTLALPAANGGLPDGTIDAGKVDWNSVPPAIIDGNAIRNNTLNGSALINETVGNTKLTNSSINAGEKLVDNSIPETKYSPASVSTRALANGSVTTNKLATGATVGNILADTLNGNVIIDGTISNAKLQPIQNGVIDAGAVTGDKIGVNTITEGNIASGAIESRHLNSNTADSDGGLTVNPAGMAIANVITAGTQAGINYDEHGLITGVAPDGLVPRVDLPLATATDIGAVSIPAEGGLEVSGAGALSHQNSIVATTFAGVSFDEHGHIVATDSTGKVPAADLPFAGTTPENIGAVYIPDQAPLRVEEDGAVYHQNTDVTPGTYSKVTVSLTGHVVDGSSIEPSDIPDLPASIITTGQFGSGRIADGAITSPKIDDYATCLMQEDFPGQGDYLGQFWYTPSTAQLRVYSRGSGPQNIWLPVGFGLLQQQNLRFAFTFDATTSTISSITQYGAPLGLAVGDPIPAPTDILSGAYGVCVVAGSGVSLLDVTGDNFTIGDWILCAGETAGWQFINTIDGGGGGGGAMFLNDLLDVTVPTPTTPLQDGQILKYDGDVGQWVNVPNTATVTIGDTPPNNATNGTLWWDTDSGRLFIWYEEPAGSDQTSQWVPATPESGLTGGGETPIPTLKFINDLNNVEAAKFAGALFQYNTANVRWESTGLINGGSFAGTFFAEAPATALAVVQPENLNDLNDVDATNTDKAFLQYNAGTSLWESQLNFDGGNYPSVTLLEDFVEPSVVGTTSIENLNDFLDVQVLEIDESYLIYNDNLNRWEQTTIIGGGSF